MALDPLAPIRLGVRIGLGVLRWELRVVERVLGLDDDEPIAVVVDEEPFVAPAPPPPPPVELTRHPVAPEPETAPEPEPTREPEPEAPVHIDTEPELVGEFAEPGAEEGAGPEIHVDEPWDGYASMQAADIRDRVAVASAEELAVVQLYEGTHRRRRTILDAVERRQRELANAPAGR